MAHHVCPHEYEREGQTDSHQSPNTAFPDARKVVQCVILVNAFEEY